jgi:hypothetical protein
MTPTEFEPAVRVSKRPQTDAIERAATGIGILLLLILQYFDWLAAFHLDLLQAIIFATV